MLKQVTKSAMTVEQYADRFGGFCGLTFQSKETRDAVAAELKKRGKSFKKCSTRGQRMHPEYVTDFVGTYETGFGNQDYLTTWKVLYTIENA